MSEAPTEAVLPALKSLRAKGWLATLALLAYVAGAALYISDQRSNVLHTVQQLEQLALHEKALALAEASLNAALVDASELDTRLIMRPLRNTERVLVNAGVERLLAKEKEMGAGLTFADIAPEVAGVYPAIMRDGQMDAGGWSCGMVAGLIHDIPTCKELIDRIMSEAEQIIRGRLEGFLAA